MKTMRLLACGSLVTVIGILFGCGTSATDGTIASSSDPIISQDKAREAIQYACHGTFKNHGACVSCVAHAANDLKGQSKITGAMEGDLVSEFAKGYCKNACIPTICGSEQCDTIPDGCGGTVTCDICSLGKMCVNNMCVCKPELDAKICGSKTCGEAINNCGYKVSCGTCPSDKTCNMATSTCEGGTTPTTCGPGQCGTISDGCGGTVTCDPCPDGKMCSYNMCVCKPELDAKICGSKVCGEAINNCGHKVICGTCPADKTCSSDGSCCVSDTSTPY